MKIALPTWLRGRKTLDDRHLMLSIPLHLAVLLVAVVAGQWVYADLLSDRHTQLRATVAGTDALCLVLQRSQVASGPDGATSVCDATERSTPAAEAETLLPHEQTARFRAWLSGLQVASPGDDELDLSSVADTRWGLLHRAITSRPHLREQLELRVPPKMPSTVFLAEAVAGLNTLSTAGNSCGLKTPEALIQAHARVLPAVLAAEPVFEWNTTNVRALADVYRERATDQWKASKYGDCVQRIDSVVPEKPPSDWKRFGLMLRGPSRVPDSIVLQALLRGFGVLEEGGWYARATSELPAIDVKAAPMAGAAQTAETEAEPQEAAATATAEQAATSPAQTSTPIASEKDVARQRATADFLLSLMSEVRAAPAVRSAQMGVTLWRGGEQLAMITVAIWAMLLIALRALRTVDATRALRALRSITVVSDEDLATTKVEARARRVAEVGVRSPDRLKAAASVLKLEEILSTLPAGSPLYLATTTSNMARSGIFDAAALRAVTQTEADALYNSGWLIRLLLAVLPAIGFLGTVLGIMAALADVDAISRVPAGPQQAVEVSFVAGTLGLAFATTAIALFAGLILRFLHELLAAFETRMVTELEALLTPLVDPTLWHDTE